MEPKSILVDAWLVEKVVNSLREVSVAIWNSEKLKDSTLEPPLTFEQEIQLEFFIECVKENISTLYAALVDLTKVAEALHSNKTWDSWDAKHIQKRGEVGLTDILIKYGLSDYARSPSTREVVTKLNKVKELAEGGRGENRTFIYDELIVLAKYDPTAKTILSLLDPVSMGTKSWKVFQDEVRTILSGLRKTFPDD